MPRASNRHRTRTVRQWGLRLRCAEVAALRLEDIDWPVGIVTIHGKGNRIE